MGNDTRTDSGTTFLRGFTARSTLGATALGVFLIVALVWPYLPTTGQFEVFLFAQILVFATAALAYNVLLGYTGLLSFGHAAFFGGAAYAVGLTIEYVGIQEFFVLLPIGLLAAIALAAVLGYISVRHTEVYYALLMLALAHMLYILALKFYTITGGTDGIGIATPTVAGVNYVQAWGYTGFLLGVLYYLILFGFLLTAVLLWVFMHSPFGLTLRTIRDSPKRASAIGVPVRRYRWYASIVSGTFTGLGGIMYAFLNSHITPNTVLHWALSGELAFMTVLGGPGAFFGPAIGAGVYILIRNYALQATTYWHFMLGAVLLGVVLLFPGGIGGTASWARQRFGFLGERTPEGKGGTSAMETGATPERERSEPDEREPREDGGGVVTRDHEDDDRPEADDRGAISSEGISSRDPDRRNGSEQR